MPLGNLVKNSTYYWGFAAAVAYPLVHPAFTAPGKTQVAVAAALWLASQATNFAVHYSLANMRAKPGDKTRSPPTGALFSLVSCPNYTAEFLGWVAWTAATQVALGGVFTLVGLAQMTQWAVEKHVAYTDDFPEIKKRRAILPFLI